MFKPLFQHLMSKIKVLFLIDEEQKRVVLAEAGIDFVDVLFSFLAWLLGSVVWLLKKQSGLGSLDSLYESVEQLDAKHLQTEACKEMLLNPRSAAAELCEVLKIKNIHDLVPRDSHRCSEYGYLIHSTTYHSFTRKCRCIHCGKLMNESTVWPKSASNGNDVFLTDDTCEFIIMDDLQVIPASFKMGISLLKELQIKDSSSLEERVIEFSTEEALTLRGRSLVSKNSLTGVYFPDSCIQASADRLFLIKKEMSKDETEDAIVLNLVLNTKTNTVLYAEVEEDFANQLRSFLTFPLGSVLKFLIDNTVFDGCINTLYSSAKNMSFDCFKSEICRNVLLAPKLCAFYGLRNQILKLDEITSRDAAISRSCLRCYWDNGNEYCTSAPCQHGVKSSELIELDPKSVRGVEDSGGVFVSSSRSFMVADNLHISQLSFISAVGNELKSPISNLVVKEVSFDKVKALSLLSAMLISKTALTDVFSPTEVFHPEPKQSRRSQRVQKDP